MLTVTFNDLWSRKRRLVGMFTAVMVGVAFLAGTLVLGDTVRDSFGTLFTEANQGTAALVRSEHRMTVDGETEQAAIPASLTSQSGTGSAGWRFRARMPSGPSWTPPGWCRCPTTSASRQPPPCSSRA